MAQDLWIPESVGERVGLLRRRRRWSQTQLARKIADLGVNVDHSTLSQVESGRRRASFAQLLGLSWTLEVSVADLGATEADYPELRLLADPMFVRKLETDGTAA